MTSTTRSTSSSISSIACTDTNVTANSPPTIEQRHGRVGDLEGDVLVDLAGQAGVARAAPEADDDDRDEHGHDEHADDERR